MKTNTKTNLKSWIKSFWPEKKIEVYLGIVDFTWTLDGEKCFAKTSLYKRVGVSSGKIYRIYAKNHMYYFELDINAYERNQTVVILRKKYMS